MSRTAHSNCFDYMANVHTLKYPENIRAQCPRVHSWSKTIGFRRVLSATPSKFAIGCLNINVLQFTKVSIFITFEESCWIFHYDLPVRVFLPQFSSLYQHFFLLLGNQRAVHLFSINLCFILFLTIDEGVILQLICIRQYQ